ncbi:MAG: glycine--tRNA ligase [Candidatus Parvarchaeota archaeon]|jgi:glycyl-tRNA synthetase|nr:glycine--tRNA ligase [Candidatus Parvarchaeota archaeon]MCL5106629.1 glycine--tRNA ligase [Candidatus Parvarchaeota archaeon]
MEAERDEELLRIALSRGIFFHSSEVFSDNVAGFWDYGPIGVRILNNLLEQWRQTVYSMNGLEISGSVILPRIVLQASGHEDNFFDMEIKCNKCGTVYRVDKLLEEKDSSKNFEGLTEEEYLKYIKEYSIKCSKCGGELDGIKKFGTMFPVKVGDDLEAYLRPEACQSIFLDFKRVFEAYGKKLPMAIAQVGKAFRNEISPRNNLLRQREFYQNDIEIFFIEDDFKVEEDYKINVYDKKDKDLTAIGIKDALSKGVIKSSVTAYGISKIHGFLLNVGFKNENIRYRKLYEDKAFYSKESFDVEIRKQDLWVELIACNNRGEHDLLSYEKYGAKGLRVDGKIPQIFEISMGTDRLFYLLLFSSFRKDEQRAWLSMNSIISPFKAAVFPLVSKDDLDVKANSLFESSKYKNDILYSDNGSIGKRYRRAEEVGIKIAFTVDYDTMKDDTITVRESDSMKQFRIDSNKMDMVIFESALNDFEGLRKKYEYH